MGEAAGRAARRDEPEGAGAALPRADGRLEPDGAAAARTTSCAWRSRRCRRSAAARSRSTRTASTRRSRSRQSTPRGSRCGRSRSSSTRPAGPTPPTRSAASYFLEALTDELEARALELIEPRRRGRRRRRGDRARLRPAGDRGGRVPLQQQVESGERVVVGVNCFADGEEERIELHRLDPEIERRQLERTAAAARRARRRGGGGGAGGGAAGGGTAENLLPPMREALRARSTVGEICEVLREEWGTYDAQR